MATERLQRRIDRLLDQIEEAADQQDWATVHTLAEEVLHMDNDNIDAQSFFTMAERRLTSVDTSAAVEASSSATVDRQSTETTPIVTSQPTSFANGRYTVSKFLGEGGKKRVYLAKDTLLDRDVAFALIKTEGLDDVSRTRISREAQAMGRLGSHPHIVTVFDLGDHEGQPFMVTELMGGGDVEAIIEDAPDHRLPLEQAIRIAMETCRGLEFAHSRGIIHRDLKPGNVWLTEDGTAKIGDFGLAVATDRSRLTQEGMMVGTVSYMPPEQAMGGETTAQADLYSLGAMLYEMVAGRPPFLGDDSVAIIGQHINTPPVAPTWHRQECPKLLEALILRLLAKNPAERPESATDVLTALDGIDLSVDVGADGGTSTEEANALDSLAGGVFVGRHAEMGELKAALEDALSGRGRMLTLVGEPGIGKTRTAQELATYANLRGAQVLWGRCLENRGAPPYWPWVQVIRSYVREHEPQQISSEMGSGAADIAEIVSDVRERLPGLPDAPALDDPEQARFRLFDSITAFLKSASRNQPLVVILDNLHWADKPSLLLLEFLAPELANSRLLVIGTYRDVDLSRQHPLVETLGELTRERLFQRVLLRGLTQDDVSRFIEATSGINPPSGLVRTIHTQTEGNPLFVTEVVRLLVQEGELTQDQSERDSWDVRIPEGVREVIGRRLNRLTERCNETLTIAAVIGREFDMRQLERLVDDMSSDRLLDVLEEALSARVIEELPRTVGRYEFTHALIQQTLMDELSTTRRVRLHARIIEVFEELYGDNVNANAVEMAYHAAEAEAMIGPEKLALYSKLAGERALESLAYEDAATFFERALSAREGDAINAETAQILSSLGRAQIALGEAEHAVPNLQRAFEYYADVGDTARAVATVEYPHNVQLLILMTKMLSQAVELVPSESIQSARLLCSYGLSVGVRADGYEEGMEALEKSLAIAKREGDLALERRIMAASANVDGYHMNWRQSVEKSLRALELVSQVDDDPIDKLRAHLWVANSSIALGEPELAHKHASEMMALVESLRDRGWLQRALNPNLSLAAYEGQWDMVQALAERDATSYYREHANDIQALAMYQIGDFDKGKAFLQDQQANPTSAAIRSLVTASISRFTSETGSLAEVENVAKASIANRGLGPLIAMAAHSALAIIAVLRKDMSLASKQTKLLKPYRNTALIFGLGSIDRVLGLLAHTMGNLDDSHTHFEDALAFCCKAGYRPELAWSLCDYADMLLERNSEGDHQKAMQLLDESLQISTELGMRPLMERVLSRREILKA